MNVSRGGLLLGSAEPLRPGHPLWVAFPFDPENTSAQPEQIAQVVRCVESGGAPSAYWNLAVQFAPVSVHAGQSAVFRRSGGETVTPQNGGGDGRGLALPIRVRPKMIPWHEETMTIEISFDKLKFQTNREYHFGERLMVAFATPAEGPWSRDGECETEVVGIETSLEMDCLQVIVRRKTG
jgi:hypothetical protein